MDIFCLQEVWYADTQKKIYNDVKDYYPYVLSAVDLTDNTVSSEPACTVDVLIPALECQRNACSAFADDVTRFRICGVLRYVHRGREQGGVSMGFIDITAHPLNAVACRRSHNCLNHV